ncbi:MAG: response regulator [Lachnospiraceae bacterium]|nr:response regulator [Lachnospiraceae bacterium]
MKKTILIVAPAEGFIIKGLETKLLGIGVESEYSPPKLKELQNKCYKGDLIIIFTDDSVESIADVFVFIKDFCIERDKQVIVVGTKNEYDVLKEYITEDIIAEFFERPLDIGSLLNKVESCLEKGTEQERRKSILVVDDDVSYMSMIMDWLKDSYRVSLANSGMSAITWLAKNRADLILLDYEMPITTGPKVLEMLRSDAELSDIPVMFLTGKGDKESIMKVLALKPVGYLLKTVKKEELRGTIKKFFVTQTVKSS